MALAQTPPFLIPVFIAHCQYRLWKLLSEVTCSTLNSCGCRGCSQHSKAQAECRTALLAGEQQCQSWWLDDLDSVQLQVEVTVDLQVSVLLDWLAEHCLHSKLGSAKASNPGQQGVTVCPTVGLNFFTN